ncbi:MAG TPA: hypothetical protein VG940_08820 [Gemmatimonadales bacterium]|nr:hypothetical protein [Gemmatimonadales bacterium]
MNRWSCGTARWAVDATTVVATVTGAASEMVAGQCVTIGHCL